MKTKPWAFALVILCTLFTTSGQICFKMASSRLSLDLHALLTNWPLFLGFFIYAMGALLLIISLKGGELSILYPLIATSFIWVSLASYYIFNDTLNVFKWVGIFFIILGITFMGVASKK